MPTIFVILGATGDLSKSKLLPALFDLYMRGAMPSRFAIVGMAIDDHTTDTYREWAAAAIRTDHSEHNPGDIEQFAACITYRSGDFTEPNDHRALSEHLIERESEFGQCSNKLFYLAVPPRFYEPILRDLADSGLTIPCSHDTGWTRVLIEKPFGNNAESARELDHTLSLLFNEEQIFRIDHYLAKETLQDILMFRFSNLIFEPLWNAAYIERVAITLHETDDARDRGAFYDGVGALRDVGQNHMLQMLAAVAMEHPGALDADAIRDVRKRVFEALRPMDPEMVAETVTRGQYEGYTNEEGVAPDSATETFFRFTAYIDNERWRNVPFVVESGKALGAQKAEITITFKETDTCFCTSEMTTHHANAITFRMQPEEEVTITFWAKERGFHYALESHELSFDRTSSASSEVEIPDAYERLLYDAISGDRTLFTSTEEQNAAWAFIMSILRHWDTLPLYTYAKGSNGPESRSQ